MTGRSTPSETEKLEAPPRLFGQRDPIGRALFELESFAREPRPQAQARVWRRLGDPSWTARHIVYLKYLLPAGAAMLLALLVLARGKLANEAEGRWSLRQSDGPVAMSNPGVAHSLEANPAPRAGEPIPENAVLETGASASASLEDGRTRLSLAPSTRLELRGGPRVVAGQVGVTVLDERSFTIAAGAYIVEGGGNFSVEVSERRVRLSAGDRKLRVRGSSGNAREVPPGYSWSAGDAGEKLERGDARVASDADDSRQVALYHPDADPLREGEAKEGRGDYAGAAAIYQAAARENGPRAATALYALARLRLRFLHDPQGALASLDEETRRFPSGPLSQEVALTEVEARLDLRDDAATLRAMNGFLDSYASSERAAEVRWLRASLELRASGCAAAKADLDALASDETWAGEAIFSQAICARRGGDESSARAHLRDYLHRFPQGPRARDAQDALARGGAR